MMFSITDFGSATQLKSRSSEHGVRDMSKTMDSALSYSEQNSCSTSTATNCAADPEAVLTKRAKKNARQRARYASDIENERAKADARMKRFLAAHPNYQYKRNPIKARIYTKRWR